MASEREAEENINNLQIQYISSEDLVEISIPKEPEAIIITGGEGYQNLTNKKDVKNRLSILGLSWRKFVNELNKMPEIYDYVEISEQKFNEIIGTLLLEKQDQNDLAYANRLNGELNGPDDSYEEEEKRSEI